MRKPPAIVDLNALPALLTIKDIAGVRRLSYSTIRRRLQNGTFTPLPWDWSPLLWNRDDVVEDLKRRRDQGPTGPQGGRRMPAKAALTPRRAPRRAPRGAVASEPRALKRA